MAERLVEGMVSSFEPEKYEDEYRRDLMRLIQRKAKAGELNRIPDAAKKRPKAPAAPGPVDLSELLARSLAGAKQGPRAANENHRPTKKARTAKKPHAETHHRKSA
jgi:DNA end-binding protein Ku